MIEDLLALPARDLLKKFGAGQHKPGSGSAVALLGLLAVKLSQTVLALTVGRPGYEEQATVVAAHEDRLESIGSILEGAFQRDSELFDEVIRLRRERDHLKGGPKAERDRVTSQLAKVTWMSTDLPLEMVETFLELGEIGIDIFRLGFRSARGDSAVAVRAAQSSAHGALAIVLLNLQSTRDPSRSRAALARAESLRATLIEQIERFERVEATLRDETTAKLETVEVAQSKPAPR